MKRAVFVMLSLVAVCGCTGTPPRSVDPFMSRIAPPGTGMAQPPAAGATNYYVPPAGLAPASTGAPVPGPTQGSSLRTGGPLRPAETSVMVSSLDRPSQPAAQSSAEGLKKATFVTPSVAHEPVADDEMPVRIVEPRKTAPQPPPVVAAVENKPTAASEPGRIKSGGEMTEITQLPKVPKASTASAVSPASRPQSIQKKSVPAARGLVTGTRERYGYSSDYRQLRGKLEHSASSGTWKLRYIPIDGRTDRNGGSVELVGMKASAPNHKDGEFVTVQGRLGERSSDEQGYAPRYHISSIRSLAGSKFSLPK